MILKVQRRIANNNNANHDDSCLPHLYRKYEIKQINALSQKKQTDKSWDSISKTLSNATSRPIEKSLIRNSEEFRERVEKLSVLEQATSSDSKYGERNWCLGLRSNSMMKEPKHYIMPVGNPLNGLYVRMESNIHKKIDVVRKPALARLSQMSFKNFPYYADRMSSEKAKVASLMAGRDDCVDSLCVMDVIR
jgi:hypothetical protein